MNFFDLDIYEANEFESLYLNRNIVDLDADGDVDVLATSFSSGKILWFDNDGTRNAFGSPRVIQGSRFLSQIDAFDIDGDDRLDILTAANAQEGQMGRVEWFRGIEDESGFSKPQTVAVDALSPTTVSLGDVDKDGDQDIIVRWFSGANRNKLSLYENLGGGTFGPESIINQNHRLQRDFDHPFPLITDMDGDGDADILSVYPSETVWFENTDGQGSFSEPQRIIEFDARVYTQSVEHADLDQDGDLDLITIHQEFRNPLTQVRWYAKENDGPRFSESREVTSYSQEGESVSDVRADDLDGDGDLDVIFTDSDGMVAWHENSEDRFNGERNIIRQPADLVNLFPLSSFSFADIDGDDDLDFVTANNDIPKSTISWFRNVGLAGDSDGNGQFDSKDLTLAFTSGEYEDETAGNSTYEEGDWNGDGDFNTSDLVFAFQHGNFIKVARSLEFAAAVDLVFEDKSKSLIMIPDTASTRNANLFRQHAPIY